MEDCLIALAIAVLAIIILIVRLYKSCRRIYGLEYDLKTCQRTIKTSEGIADLWQSRYSNASLTTAHLKTENESLKKKINQYQSDSPQL